MAAGLALMLLFGLMVEWAFRKKGLPGVVGMILVGIVVGPHMLGALDPRLMAVSADLRLIALIIILLRAGLELRRSTLNRIGARAILLSFIPALFEGFAVTAAGYILLDLTLLESALLGSVLAAVSPAVVVPRMIRFIQAGKGAEREVPTLVLAGASLDDVNVIVAHGVLLSIYLGMNSNLAWRLTGIPISLILGAAAGIGVGFALCRFFDRFNPRATKRVLALLAISVGLIYLQDHIKGYVPFAGLVGVMFIGIVMLESRERYAHEISAKLGKIWIFAEIVLFSLVGAELDVRVMVNAGLAGAGVIGFGLIFRCVGAWLCLVRSRFTRGEKLFVVVSYLPKATVQAAIGAGPLAAMRLAGMNTAPGEIILAVSVLAILITAPLGAWLSDVVGERVLTEPEDKPQADLSPSKSCLNRSNSNETT